LKRVLLNLFPGIDSNGDKLTESYLEQQLTGYDETWPQHYGFPTAALDWSRDPFIALYLANREYIDSDLSAKTEQSEVRAILPYKEIPTCRFVILGYKEIDGQNSPVEIKEPDSWIENRNAQAQKGLFTYFTEPISFFLREERFPCIEDYSSTDRFMLTKLILDPTGKDRTNIKQLLLSKNINKYTMFPE